MKNSKKTAKKITSKSIPAQTPPADENRAEDQARAQLSSILEMVAAMKKADEGDDETARDNTRETIQNDALAVEVRTDWHAVGAEDDKPTEFRILLCTGGPAVQIVGELSQYGEPERAEIQFQDWFTPWTTLRGVSAEDEAALLDYCRTFYFGE